MSALFILVSFSVDRRNRFVNSDPFWVQFLICQVSCTELSRLVFVELVLNLRTYICSLFICRGVLHTPIPKCGVGRSAEPFCDIEPVSGSMFEQPNAIYLNSKFHFLSKRLTADVHMFALFFSVEF